MSDDEDDYMSAIFSNVNEDVRPGLVQSTTLKRKYEIEKKAAAANKKNKTKPLRVIEEEQRNAGLDTALSSNNKGFLMLQKMGFKPGMKLGAQKDLSNIKLSEPIRIQIKNNREGLGSEEAIRQRISEKEKFVAGIRASKERETARLTEEFRERMRNKVTFKHLMSDLNKTRKVCEQLDIGEGIQEPMRSWFWFSAECQEEQEDEEESEDEEEDDELPPEDQLFFINNYLRSKYFYCTWCGTKYTDEADLTSNCPGTEKEDHE